MPDIVYTWTGTYEYPEGVEAAVEDGYFLRLNELIDQYAPNYKKALEADPAIKKDVMTDSGLLWGFSMIYMNGGKQCNWGPCIREDFLNKLGLQKPVTCDDWHSVLTAFKNDLNIEFPLLISSYGSARYDDWMAGYGVDQSFFQVDGKVKFGPVEDGYGEYIDMMAQWFKEGLIYTDFALQGANSDIGDDLALTDRVGAWAEYASKSGHNYFTNRGATNPDFLLSGTSLPVKAAGDTTHLRCMDTVVNEYSMMISADCEHPDIAARWLDIFYNTDYTDIFNYGIREGESYVVNADGSLSWGDLINANTEGLTKNHARCKYTMANAFYENYKRVSDSWSDSQKESQQLWLKGDDDWELSKFLAPTADENREFNTIMMDINTFVQEETAKMIMGSSTYTFETFRQKIQEMSIARAIEIKQAVVDRYNNR